MYCLTKTGQRPSTNPVLHAVGVQNPRLAIQPQPLSLEFVANLCRALLTCVLGSTAAPCPASADPLRGSMAAASESAWTIA